MSTTTTSAETIGIREAIADDHNELASMLASSFQTCPAWHWYLPPDTKQRLPRMKRFFSFLLERFYLEAKGRECLTTESRAGAALWDSPERWEMSAGQNARMVAAMVPVFRQWLPRALRGSHWLPRALRGFGALDSEHPREPHYYLSVLGVSPDAKDAEVVEALLRPGLERCDRERMPAYTETGRPGSRDFYIRHGFEVIEQFDLPGGGPPVWRLWRDPQSESPRTQENA